MSPHRLHSKLNALALAGAAAGTWWQVRSARLPDNVQQIVLLLPDAESNDPVQVQAWQDAAEELGIHLVPRTASQVMRAGRQAQGTAFILPDTLHRRMSDVLIGHLRERVRAVLLETLPAGISSIDAVAQRLAISKRSLQRQLADESVGFQELLSEVRHELARHYLSRTDISAGEISWLLGFQESNSFIRAFRSWTGTTPAAYRQGRVGMATH